MDKKKVLITSALPYVNNIPHLGNLIGCVLSADVFSRFSKMMGKEVLFICGSDEHGTATEKKALEEGVTPAEVCDKYNKIHQEIYSWFGIEFDHYGRTSKKIHHKITQELFHKVKENGYIHEDMTTQLYDEKSETFLADRFVGGTCPHCSFEEASGDQCDSCGQLLNPMELINPISKISGTVPVPRDTKHLFLDLGKLSSKIEKWFLESSSSGRWTANSIKITESWLKKGLKPRAITRDLKWGIPVPGFEDKVFYVWFDAPIGYISITADLLGDDYKKWWMNPNEVRLVQFMGKDNVPFHSIIFPGILLGSGLDYTLVNTLNSTEYLNYEDTKFSKSRGVGLFGDQAMETGIPADVFRYTLIANRPESSDTKFYWTDLADRVNNELVANYGNLVNRVVMFLNKYFDSSLCEVTLNDDDEKLLSEIEKVRAEYLRVMEYGNLREGLQCVMRCSKLANGYFQSQEPWRLRNTDAIRAKSVLSLLAAVVKDITLMMYPFMPKIASDALEQLQFTGMRLHSEFGLLFEESHRVGKASVLFSKLEDKFVEELRIKYSGKEEPEFKFSDVDIRTVEIEKVEPHPNADKLYVLTFNVGALGKRVVCSGLVDNYSAEELVGKKTCMVFNLKPAKLRGVKSNGMILAVEGPDKACKIVEHDGRPGERVYFVDEKPGKPRKEITIDEFFSFTISAKDGSALLEGKKLGVGDKAIKTLIDGKVC